MSFILDALKRAERERRLERAPDLNAVFEEGEGSQASRWQWLSIGVAFLVGAVVVALFLWPKKQPPEVISKHEEPAVKVASLTSDQKKPLPDRSEAKPSPRKETAPQKGVEIHREVRLPDKAAPQPIRPRAKKVEIVKPAKVTPTQKAEGPPQKKGPPDTSIEPAVSEKTVSGSGPSKPAAPKIPATSPPPAVAPKETAPLEPHKSARDRATDIPEPQPKAKEETVKEPVEAVPLLQDLPDEVRKKLGKLEINVHGYSRDPAESLVFINMRKYRVGDRIGSGKDGPMLKRIIPDGVIIDYGEGQARLVVGK
ncbi:MAG: general secretion pathway protein GspB [Desulfobacteraceae bacterium]|nr:general secretion pathway protein GspB [Desulfobacteraceae bacterium]